MKKSIAVVLLMVHLFNWGGYLAVHQYMVYRSNRLYNEQTKKGLFDVSDLSEIKVPFYSRDAKEGEYFRQVTGSVRFKNASYNYVAVKRTRDTLHLLCLPNYETTTLVAHDIIWVLSIKDIPVPKKEHVPYAGFLLPAAFMFNFRYTVIAPPVIAFIENSTAYREILVSRHIDILKQPPKFLC